MARSGVLFEEVKQAAEAMIAEGINPTHARIREALGGGSFSTIGKHLHAWRQACRQDTEAAPPPAGLQDVIRQVWRELDATAAERVATAEREAEEHAAQAAQAADARIAEVEAQARTEVEAAQVAQAALQEEARREVAAAIEGWKISEERNRGLLQDLQARDQKLQAAAEDNARLAERLEASLAERQKEQAGATQAAEAVEQRFTQWRADLERDRAQCISTAKQATEASEVLVAELHALREIQARAAREHEAALQREQAAHQTTQRNVGAAEQRTAQLTERFTALQAAHDAALAAVKLAQQGHAAFESAFQGLRKDVGAFRHHLNERDKHTSDWLQAAEKRLVTHMKKSS